MRVIEDKNGGYYTFYLNIIQITVNEEAYYALDSWLGKNEED